MGHVYSLLSGLCLFPTQWVMFVPYPVGHVCSLLGLTCSPLASYHILINHSVLQIQHLKDVTQTQQRPESPTVTLTWHASKHKLHKSTWGTSFSLSHPTKEMCEKVFCSVWNFKNNAVHGSAGISMIWFMHFHRRSWFLGYFVVRKEELQSSLTIHLMTSSNLARSQWLMLVHNPT